VVKKFGEISLAGITYGNPSNQCWPEPMPFIFKRIAMQMIQQPDKVTILYGEDHEVRRVRLSEPHQTPVTPSWYGDSVGHYEGDTLVVDTVGVKTYRLRDWDDVKDAVERGKKENWLPAGDIFSQHRGKFLQLHVTIEDERRLHHALDLCAGARPIGGRGLCRKHPSILLQQRG
jgi:hypothetical protein